MSEESPTPHADLVDIVLSRAKYHDVPFAELFPILRDRTGRIDPSSVPSSCVSAIARNAPTWEQLRTESVTSVRGWPHVGDIRAASVVRFVAEATVTLPPSDLKPLNELRLREALAHLELLAAWAVARGSDSGLAEWLVPDPSRREPPSVTNARAALDVLDLESIVDPALVKRFDPLEAATHLLAQFEGRDRDILARILRKPLGTAPTLAELGDTHGITRERIRQLESKLLSGLEQQLRSPAYESITMRSEEIGELLGAAAPLDELPPEFTPDDSTLLDEFFMWLAGPYRVEGDWLVRRDISSLTALVTTSLEESADGAGAPLDAVLDAIESRGVHHHHAQRLVTTTNSVRVLGERVIRWRHLRERICGVLEHEGRPMTADELIAAIGEVGNERSVLNHLSTSQHVKRIGLRTWALTEWAGEEYTTIVRHMAEQLSDGPQPLVQVQDDLSRRFGIATTSISMHASMHPAFILESGTVRLRRTDEPYVPAASLELTGCCYVVDGAWAYAVTVDHDLRRGSGRAVPESYAVHLGLHPGTTGSISTVSPRSVSVGWNGIRPWIGSLRWLVESHQLVDGDRLFIRRSTPSSLDFRWVRRSDLERVSHRQRLALLVGAEPATAASTPLQRWLSDALGLGAATATPIEQIRRRLETRAEADLVDLLAQLGPDLY